MKGWYLLMLLPIIFSNCKKEDQFQIDRDIILQYVENATLDFIEDPSGLFYANRVEGSGEEFPTLQNKVKVAYKGYLLDGTVFDETEPGEVVSFQLGGLIEGWQIGIAKMKRGGESTLVIPSALGYGNRATGLIPPNSVLIFEIRLVDFE